jgi:hypothetical protein
MADRCQTWGHVRIWAQDYELPTQSLTACRHIATSAKVIVYSNEAKDGI